MINKKYCRCIMFVLLYIILAIRPFYSYSQVCSDDSFVVKWLVFEYKSKGYLKYYLEGLDVNDEHKYSEYIHIVPLEEIKSSGQKIKIYIAGINSSNYYDDIIVFYKNIITGEHHIEYLFTYGDSCDMYGVYNFFNKYKEFSEKTKLKCYERIIINMHYIESDIKMLQAE